ncbi:MAG TPA: hypothetical protein VJV97_07675 [Gemmatimonadaceae bacterium]|nr:hypothetical protein [Gemmatimonadaceae bacterium]
MMLFFKRCAARILPRSFIVAATVGIVVFLNVSFADAKLGFGEGCGNICAFQSPAALRSDGRELLVVGHVTCDANVQGWKLHLSVTQESTTASVRAVISDDCSDGPIPFAVHAQVLDGAPSFEPGKVLACGMLLTGAGANIAHGGFWCRFIEIRIAPIVSP